MPKSSSKVEFAPQYSAPLVEQIAEFLTNAIVEGQVKDGQRLGENELQRRFGVSRASIREAFRILEKKSLVVIIPRDGTYVRKITRKDVEENFPVRANLEGLAAFTAANNLKNKTIKKMELAFSQMAESAGRNDFESYLKYHSQFHEILIKASNNDTLIEILENLRRQAFWFRFTYPYVQEELDRAIREHKEILELLIQKKASQLEILVKKQIMNGRDRYLKILK